MFINELAEPQLLVIYPGRFQPFHKGHHAVYEYLIGKFGRNNVFIATSNKTDNLKSPFTFAEKSYFMQLTGVPVDRIIQCPQPYKIEQVIASGNINIANPSNTVAIFAISEKDMEDDPRFSFAAKKDGSPSYFQQLVSIKDTESMDKHGYVMTVPTFDFNVLGQPMRSGTELRNMYGKADEKQRQAIIADLFGRYTREAEQVMSAKISPAPPATGTEPVSETVSAFLPAKQNTDHGYYKLLAHRYKQDPRSLSTKEKEQLHSYIIQQKVFKECGGTGVVASAGQANDKRYSNSLTKDVRPGQVNKNLKAFNLAEQEPYQQNIQKLTLHWIERINDEIDEIKERLHSEKLSVEHVQSLKKRIKKLEADRVNVALGKA